MKADITPYEHKVQYYETDGMRIVHHSNYIRWMEEARCDYLVQAGIPYEDLEERGILLPVLSASCTYKTPAVFGDVVTVTMEVAWFDGVRYAVNYRITSQEGEVLHAEGETTHCFLHTDLRPMNIRRNAPDIFEKFIEYAGELRGRLGKTHGNNKE